MKLNIHVLDLPHEYYKLNITLKLSSIKSVLTCNFNLESNGTLPKI